MLVIIATALVFRLTKWTHPTENLLGENDEGIYAVSAVNLSRTGDYFLHASLVPSLLPKFQPWVLKHEPLMANRTAKPPERFLCYHTCLFVADQSRGLLAPQFPAGFPVLLGSVYSFFGYNGLRMVNLLLTVIAAGLTGLLAAKWLGKTTGAAACVLMLWFPLQVWVGNTLFAEPLAQLLWLLALLGWAERDATPRLAGLLGGCAAGLGLAVKIDALPVLLLAVLALLVGWKRQPRFSSVLTIALAFTGTVSLASWWLYNRPYVESTLRALAETNTAPLIAVAALGLSALLLALLLKRSSQAVDFWLRHGATLRRVGLLFGIALGLGLAGYAYFVRAHPATPDMFYYWPFGRNIRSHREETLLRLGWYWQSWGLAIAVLGIGTLLTRAREFWQWLLLGLGLLFLLSFCYDLRNNPIQPYGLRRFLPYAMPLMVFGAVGIWSWLKQETLRTWLTAITCIALAAGFFPINEKLNSVQEYPGLIAQIESFSREIPDGAVILVPDDSLLVHLATPLEFVFGKRCLVIRNNMPSHQFDQATRSQIHDWQAGGQRVLLLTQRAGENLPLFNVQAQLLTQGEIDTKTTTQSAESLVTAQSMLGMSWALSEILPLAAPAPHPPHGAP